MGFLAEAAWERINCELWFVINATTATACIIVSWSDYTLLSCLLAVGICFRFITAIHAPLRKLAFGG